jgi:hypothetical protein
MYEVLEYCIWRVFNTDYRWVWLKLRAVFGGAEQKAIFARYDERYTGSSRRTA